MTGCVFAHLVVCGSMGVLNDFRSFDSDTEFISRFWLWWLHIVVSVELCSSLLNLVWFDLCIRQLSSSVCRVLSKIIVAWWVGGALRSTPIGSAIRCHSHSRGFIMASVGGRTGGLGPRATVHCYVECGATAFAANMVHFWQILHAQTLDGRVW